MQTSSMLDCGHHQLVHVPDDDHGLPDPAAKPGMVWCGRCRSISIVIEADTDGESGSSDKPTC